MCTSAEVLQELAHAYLPVGRKQTLDAALALITGSRVEVWPLEQEDVTLARQLHEQHPALGARDLCHSWWPDPSEPYWIRVPPLDLGEVRTIRWKADRKTKRFQSHKVSTGRDP